MATRPLLELDVPALYAGMDDRRAALGLSRQGVADELWALSAELREGDLPAGAIAEQFEMSWPSVSRHPGVLASAGLVEATRHGQQLVYSLTTSVLADIVTELADMARINRPQPGPALGKAPQPRLAAPEA